MSQKFKALRESGVSSPSSVDYPPDVLKTGVLRKLKKMKRKFFILRKKCGDIPSKLEYYPSEKKWRLGCEPKQSITLKTCFNISRKLHPKHKFVICLYTRSECFSIVMENEEEMNEWLSGMLELQLNEIDADEDPKAKPVYEHVWQVIVDDRELESCQNISGPHCLGLTSKSLSLIKISSSSENTESLDFPLMSIRRCGHSGKHFFIELGRSAVTGAGGVWMETEGTIVAQNMHETILGAMKSSRNKEELGLHSRPRSASTSENSKPIATRRPVGVVLPQPTLNSTLGNSRERCDTMPPRARTISENIQDAAYGLLSSSCSMSGHAYYRENSRPHSVYAWPSTNSPTLSSFGFNASPLSSSLYSNGSNISFHEPESPQENHLSWCVYTQHNDSNFSAEAPIPEARNEYLVMSPTDDNMNIIAKKGDYLNMNPAHSQSDDKEEIVGSSPQNVPLDYMDMRSPSNSEGYIPMSVIGSLNADVSLSKKRSSNSLSDNVERIKDGYVPMAPCGASEEVFTPMQDGYLSMSPLSNSLPKQFLDGVFGCMSSNGSNLTLDDDPAEFKLDKVQSMLKRTDEDHDHDFIKPARTYSIGSRSQIYEARTRAYSMGSERTKPEFGISVDSHMSSLKDPKCVSKSCSAPLLQESLVAPQKISSESLGDDLMEIDFQKSDVLLSNHSDSGSKKHLPKSRQRTSSRSSCATTPLLSLDEINEKVVCDESSEAYSFCESKSNEAQFGIKQNASVTTTADYVQMNHSLDDNIFASQKASQSFSHSPTNKMLVSQNSNVSSGKSFLTKTSNCSKILTTSFGYALTSAGSLSQEKKELTAKIGRYAAEGPSKTKPQDDKVLTSCMPERKNVVLSRSVSDYLSQPVKPNSVTGKSLKYKSPQSVNSSDVKTIGGQGEYMNLMLQKSRRLSPPPLQLPPKSDGSIKKAKEDKDDGFEVEPDYINIKLCKPFIPLPNPALVSATPSQRSSSESVKDSSVPSVSTIPTTTSSEIHCHRSPKEESSTALIPSRAAAVKPKSFCLPSFPAIRKQMSAPAVPPSLQPEVVSPGRKSSCPVTGSVSMIRPTPGLTSASNRLIVLPSVSSIAGFVKRASLRSPDHNVISNFSETVFSSRNSSPKSSSPSASSSCKSQGISDFQYENVCLPPSTVSSRPPSVGSEKKLNYASLDLAPTQPVEVPHSPSMLKLSHQTALDDDDDEPLTYAEIDFTKSEGLRHTSGAFREGRL